MTKQPVYILLLLLMLSCGMKTYTLLDNRTKVPVESNVYMNRSAFNNSLLNIIDTGIVYEEYDTKYNVLTRLDSHVENRFYRVCKFYSNGNFNYFTIDKEAPLFKEFDPSYSGYRGVYYQKNNLTRFDLFAGINQRQQIGKLTGTFIFKGDTMYLKRDDLAYTGIYIKRKMPPEFFTYKADW